MKYNFVKALIASVLIVTLSNCQQSNRHSSNLDYVDPYIGGVGHLLHPTRPNVQLPNQMIRMHPVRKDFLDDQISFFPLSIISHRKGELFGILPGHGNLEQGTWQNRQTYDHDLEIVRPNYFSTYLIDSDIKTEFTPGRKSGLFRFTFPDKGARVIKLQINQKGNWNIISTNSVSGVEEFFGMKAFVYGEFSEEGKTSLGEQTRYNKRKGTSRQEPGAWFEFRNDKKNTIDFKYAISFISVEQAKANLNREIPEWDFDELKEKGRQAWTKVLNKINVEGGTEAQKRVLFTSLYRTYERMVNIDEYGKIIVLTIIKFIKATAIFMLTTGFGTPIWHSIRYE